MRQRFNTYDEYIKSRQGLRDLLAIYGNTCLTAKQALDDMSKRCFFMGTRLLVATNDDMLQTLREMAYGDMIDQAPRPLDLYKYTYDEDGTLPASAPDEPEPYHIFEEPCGEGFRYVGVATREEYDKYLLENPLAY